MPDYPDCSHCSAVNTLELVYSEMGVDFAVCSCCAKTTRIDRDGVTHRVEPDRRDTNGVVMYDP